MRQRILALLIMVSILFSFAFSVEAKNSVNLKQESETNGIVIDKTISIDNNYISYLEAYSTEKGSNTDLIWNANENILTESIELVSHTDDLDVTRDNSVLLKEGFGVEYSFSVLEAGLYNLYFEYCPTKDSSEELNIELLLDNSHPFFESQNLLLPIFWIDEKKVDNNSEHAPNQKQLKFFSENCVKDNTGILSDPYLFYLSEGNHTLKLNSKNGNILFSKVGFSAPDNYEPYEKVKNEYIKQSKKHNVSPIYIEAECADLKTTRSLVAKSDSSSPMITPSNPITTKMNYIGGSNWSTANGEITWDFEIEEDGLYNIGTIFKQDLNINSFSYRTLKIDNEIPFSECRSIKFDYSIDWQFDAIGNKEDYIFYLTKGKHSFTLGTTLGEMEPVYNKLKIVTEQLGDLYLDITMIVGENPDSNRDYELFKQIPDLNERLLSMNKDINVIADDMLKLSDGETTTFISSLRNMARILNQMRNNPYSSQDYIKDYYDNYTTVSSWLYDMKSMPLSLDKIIIYPYNSNFEVDEPSFFESFWFGFKRFIAAFSADYYKSTNSDADAELKIWVNWGRDQAMVLNNLITEKFTPETGIRVNLEITNATLIKGMLSNNAPDLSLHLARTEPVNLAMRGALVDLTKFDDYEEIATRFGKSASIPYKYKDGIYALPDTQSFYIMFYRKDILDNLGIEIPETWDEFLTAAAVLQRNNMNAWIPYTQIASNTTVNTGVGGLNLFASILQQYGGEFYNEQQNACELMSETALEAFTFWTDCYTKYKLPTTTSFYNRFRVGTVPLGIETYTLYTQLVEAAPEIEGRWGIALVPGTKSDDGTINHTVSGSGTGCSILKTSKNVDAAWEFLKWWTRNDTQLEYNNNVESIIGAVSRVTTANIEAFSSMSWDKKDLEILLKQREWIQEIPEVPGSYYVSRSVDQAFWNVVDSGERPKDMLDKWGRISTKEIQRKIAEYSKK